ncbi:MAG: hypothetical protein IJU83_03585, partial [Clostridia bacterium]|nr:hypothetical protein [Clostridia bacterium]
MKRFLRLSLTLLLALLGALFLVSPFSVSSQPVNLLVDGGFEQVETNDAVYSLVKWNKNSVTVKSGYGGYYIRFTSPTWIQSKEKISLSAGEYTVKFNAKITPGSATVYVNLNDGVSDALNGNNTVVLSDLSDFTEQTIDFELESGGDYYFQMGTSEIGGRIDIDDVALYFNGSADEIGDAWRSADNNIMIENGAYLRTEKSSYGLRFTGFADKELSDATAVAYGSVKIGMIICPDDLIGENDFTVETLGSAEVKHVVCYAEKTFAAELGGKEYYGFNCAIVNILPYNVDRPFCARAFIEYQTDDKTVRFYSAESLSRSVYAVARAARNDLENLDESQKSAVEYFCGAMQTLTPLETISENGGHTFTLTFCGVKGFFVLDYDKSLYEVS